MKNHFKAIVIMILTFAMFISTQVTVKAETFAYMDAKKDVAASKPWTVNFNKPLSKATVNAANIKVLGENSKNIDVKVSLANGNKSVMVEPLKNYEYNKTYTLVVTQNVKSEDGKPLPKEVRMDFNTESAPVIVVPPVQGTAKFIVCINAARGGIDNGNIGPTGLKEKDVNLDVALRLGKLLEKENVQVVYTRSSDTVIWDSSNDIQERINIANNANADLLITISCNSVESEAPNGIETYYLKGNDKSKELAQYIQAQLISQTAAADRGAKESEYNSLKLSNAPGAMVAIGFITNKIEENKLKTSEYKDKLALAFLGAVKKYISANPKYGDVGGDTGSTPPSVSVTKYIEDITENISKGDKYNFPLKVKITTNTGEKKEVDVVWDIKQLDTSKVGSYSFKGIIKESIKKVTLVVNIMEVTKTNFKIVLDAGHGGSDSGAVGITGINEKDVALAITLKVGNILAKNGVEPIYTRVSDNIDWPINTAENLQARCDISNTAKPNYFICIHANSGVATASGIETYYFNGSAASVKLAQAVQTELIKETGRKDRGIKTENFYVLRNTDATSILIETGFLSNSEEEKLLASEEYQQRLAKAISTAILKSLGINNIV